MIRGEVGGFSDSEMTKQVEIIGKWCKNFSISCTMVLTYTKYIITITHPFVLWCMNLMWKLTFRSIFQHSDQLQKITSVGDDNNKGTTTSVETLTSELALTPHSASNTPISNNPIRDSARDFNPPPKSKYLALFQRLERVENKIKPATVNWTWSPRRYDIVSSNSPDLFKMELMEDFLNLYISAFMILTDDENIDIFIQKKIARCTVKFVPGISVSWQNAPSIHLPQPGTFLAMPSCETQPRSANSRYMFS